MLCCIRVSSQLIDALEQHIVSPSSTRLPVSVVRGSRVVELVASQADDGGCTKGHAAEVVCHDGSRYPADIVICAMHPYDLGILLSRSERIEASPYIQDNATQERREKNPEVDGDQPRVRDSQRRGVSTMASFLLALPCASWITVHAFGAHSSRRAASLGRGCFYAPDQLEPITQAEGPTQPQQPSHMQHLSLASKEAAAGVGKAIQAARQAIRVAELQLPGNLFPHAQAAALSAAGHFDSAASAWVTRAALLHAQATVRVHRIESLIGHMQQLLLPLQRLLQPHVASCAQGEEEEDNRAAGLRALGLLVAVAEDAVIRVLLREGIVTVPDDLVLCSRLSLQAEPQWPVTLQPAQGFHGAVRRQMLSSLLQQFASLRDEQWCGSPALHVVSSDVPQAEKSGLSGPPTGQPAVNKELLQAMEDSAAPPASFADGRLLFHKLRVQNAPWLQVVGPSGSLR